MMSLRFANIRLDSPESLMNLPNFVRRLFAVLFAVGTVGFVLPQASEACQPYVPMGGFWPIGVEHESTIPVDGSWLSVGNYGVYREDAEIYAEFGVKDEQKAWVEGEATVETYGELRADGEGYVQRMFVIWTPDEPLEPNQKYTLHSRTSDQEHAWGWVQDFYTSDAHQNADFSQGAKIAKIDAEYVDRPARNYRCREKKPCTTSCGCMQYYWSTRYFRIPTFDVAVQWPDLGEDSQYYTVVEDGAGTVLDIIPSTQRDAKRVYRLDHGEEAPFEFVLKTYRVGEDTPFDTDTHTITAEALPWPESTDFKPEPRPRSCAKRTTESLHSEGTSPPGGCSSASSSASTWLSLLWGVALLACLRLRGRERCEG